MKVILRTDITNIGRQGEIKEVSAGYARNYLLPHKMVMEATDNNLKLWNKEKVKLEKQREKMIQDYKNISEKIEKESFVIPVKVGESGKLFGSVTTVNIAHILEEKGFSIPKHDILLTEHIKELGSFNIGIRLHPEVIATAKIAIIEEKKK